MWAPSPSPSWYGVKLICDIGRSALCPATRRAIPIGARPERWRQVIHEVPHALNIRLRKTWLRNSYWKALRHGMSRTFFGPRIKAFDSGKNSSGMETLTHSFHSLCCQPLPFNTATYMYHLQNQPRALMYVTHDVKMK